MLLRPVQRQIEFGQPGRGEFDGLPALQNRLDQLSALVEGICEDAVDAGEKMTFTGPRAVTISCRPTAMRLAISIRWTMPSSMAARPP